MILTDRAGSSVRHAPQTWFCCLLLTVLLTGLLTGCGGGMRRSASAVSATGRATFTARWPAAGRLIPAAAGSIRIEVSRGSSVLAEQILARPAEGGSASTTFVDLPLGELAVTAKAYPNPDGTGVAQAQAYLVVTLVANQDTPVRLTMDSTIDHLDVSPGSVALAPGQSVQTSVVAKDAAGDVVLTRGSNWRWASNNPTIVSVSSSGNPTTVEGLAAGTARVTVTEVESGRSATVAVAVTTPGSNGYAITDLGTLGGAESGATDINNRGRVVGQALTAEGETHAFLWQTGPEGGTGEIRDLGTLGGRESRAAAINDNDQVVGFAKLPDGQDRAVLWQNGQMQDIGIAPGGTFSRATDINNRGQVVGEADFPDPNAGSVPINNAFLWQSGQMQPLLTLRPADETAVATGINESGHIVGYVVLHLAGGPRPGGYGFSWQAGRIESLPALGSIGTGPGFAKAYGINAGAQIVGESTTKLGVSAMLWHNGQANEVVVGAAAYDINRIGQIVGSVGGKAFVWQDGQLKDLNTAITPGSGWVLEEARAINDAGQIVGSGTVGGLRHAFLLTPR